MVEDMSLSLSLFSIFVLSFVVVISEQRRLGFGVSDRWLLRSAFGYWCLTFGGFRLLRSKIFGGFQGCGLLDFRGRIWVPGLSAFRSDFKGWIWWWLRSCDGGGTRRWMGFGSLGPWVFFFFFFFLSYGGLWLPL